MTTCTLKESQMRTPILISLTSCLTMIPPSIMGWIQIA
ncbi:hypothetical protein LINPERPRIM_LOCUS20580 [Linum perenne]